MITQRYTVLCTVSFFHSYYEKGACPTMQLLPSPSTQKRMEKAGLLLRAQSGRFTLLSEIKAHTTPEQYFPLDFSLRSTDSYFENFTRLPSANKESCLLFRCGNTHRLSVENADLPLLKPAVFRLNLEPFSKPGDMLSLNNTQDTTILQQPISTTADLSAYPFDLRNFEPGFYTVSVNEKPVLFLYSDEHLYRNPPLGIISLQADPLHAFLGKRDNPNPIAYGIEFEARRTNWKYYVINRHKKNWTDFSIVNGSTSFKNLGETRLSENTTANAVLLSEQPIPLSEKPGVKFRLTAVSDEAQEYTLIDALPAPSPERLAAHQTEPGAHCSEIYVYI